MKRCFPIALLIIFYFQAYAQHEAGMSLGAFYYVGDLNPVPGPLEAKPGLGIFYKFHYQKYLAAKVSFLYGGIKGSDAYDADYTYKNINRKVRNLSFRSNIWEIALSNEFFLINKEKGKKCSPYFLAGIGLMHFNPRTMLDGKTYDLRDYHTEGQGLPGYKKDYKLTALTGLLGFGTRYMISSRFFMGVEIGYRFTNTDYLDDVSESYADPADLYNNYGVTSVKLSDRSYEAYLNDPLVYDYVQSNNTPVVYDSQGNPHIAGYGAKGDRRGDRNKDQYMILNLTASFMLK